jgi:hypothetical protein
MEELTSVEALDKSVEALEKSISLYKEIQVLRDETIGFKRHDKIESIEDTIIYQLVPKITKQAIYSVYSTKIFAVCKAGETYSVVSCHCRVENEEAYFYFSDVTYLGHDKLYNKDYRYFCLEKKIQEGSWFYSIEEAFKRVNERKNEDIAELQSKILKLSNSKIEVRHKEIQEEVVEYMKMRSPNA